MLDDRSKLWSSIDLHAVYLGYGGAHITRRYLVDRILQYFGEEVVVLSSPGLCNILVFKSEAARSLHVKDGDDDISSAIEKVATTIKKECLAHKE